MSSVAQVEISSLPFWYANQIAFLLFSILLEKMPGNASARSLKVSFYADHNSEFDIVVCSSTISLASLYTLIHSFLIYILDTQALTAALRTSFIPSIRNKNKRSESLRQDQLFLNLFSSEEIRPMMTSKLIAKTFWMLIDKGENYPVVNAVRLLPHELYSNSILHAGIIACSRTNRPNKVYSWYFVWWQLYKLDPHNSAFLSLW